MNKKKKFQIFKLVVLVGIVPLLVWAQEGQPGTGQQGYGYYGYGQGHNPDSNYGPGEGYGMNRRRRKIQLSEQQREKINALREKKRQERKAFWNNLQNIPEEQRSEAIKNFFQKQYQENQAIMEKIHQAKYNALKEKLEQRTDLTAEQKQKILSRWQEKYQQRKQLMLQRHKQVAKLVNSVVNDDSLSWQEKEQKIRNTLRQQALKNIKRNRHQKGYGNQPPVNN